jgi:hypothetical protein
VHGDGEGDEDGLSKHEMGRGYGVSTWMGDVRGPPGSVERNKR